MNCILLIESWNKSCSNTCTWLLKYFHNLFQREGWVNVLRLRYSCYHLELGHPLGQIYMQTETLKLFWHQCHFFNSWLDSYIIKDTLLQTNQQTNTIQGLAFSLVLLTLRFTLYKIWTTKEIQNFILMFNLG